MYLRERGEDECGAAVHGSANGVTIIGSWGPLLHSPAMYGRVTILSNRPHQLRL